MGSETSGEKEAGKSSRLARENTLSAVDRFEGIADEFEDHEFVKQATQYTGEILNDPFTYNDDLKAQILGGQSGQTERQIKSALQSLSQLSENGGVGRSMAGGMGMANQIRLAGLSQRASQFADLERMAAMQRIPDMQRAIAQGFGSMDALQSREKETALTEAGTLTGLASLTNANANLAAQQESGLDTALNIAGSVAGAASAFI